MQCYQDLRPWWELHPRVRVLQTLALLLGYMATELFLKISVFLFLRQRLV